MKIVTLDVRAPDDERLTPFDTNNLFYRDQTESMIMARLRGASGTRRVRLQMHQQ